jgi:hypothetical protein
MWYMLCLVYVNIGIVVWSAYKSVSGLYLDLIGLGLYEVVDIKDYSETM